MSNTPIQGTNDSQNNNSEDLKSSEVCMNAALAEYEHTIHRSVKFENKIYVLGTIISLYSAIILSILKTLQNLNFLSRLLN